LNSFTIKHFVLLFMISCSLYFCGCSMFTGKNDLMLSLHPDTTPLQEKGWQAIQVDDADTALWNEQCQSMIVTISSALKTENLSTEALNNLLFIGIKNKKVISKEAVLLDNRTAMHTVLLGEVDNKKMKIDAYIIKKGDIVYDIVYFAPPRIFDCAHNDFKKFIHSLKFSESIAVN